MTVDELIDRLQELGGHLRVKILIRYEAEEGAEIIELVVPVIGVDYNEEQEAVVLE